MLLKGSRSGFVCAISTTGEAVFLRCQDVDFNNLAIIPQKGNVNEYGMLKVPFWKRKNLMTNLESCR